MNFWNSLQKQQGISPLLSDWSYVVPKQVEVKREVERMGGLHTQRKGKVSDVAFMPAGRVEVFVANPKDSLYYTANMRHLVSICYLG
jgi:hypothetical protein